MKFLSPLGIWSQRFPDMLMPLYLAFLVSFPSSIHAQNKVIPASATQSLGNEYSKDESSILCKSFSQGSPHLQEFYSPNYPNPYPPKVDCILTLKADFGYFIRIDFRDQFEIESSDKCEYDFLEVRDGAHGYSPLHGRYCGNKFPPIITSSDRYLWLRFTSDENIEFSGFRAVYQFIPNAALNRPDIGVCRMEIFGIEGTFSNKDISEERTNYTIEYDMPLDCTWVIAVKSGWRIQLSFPQYKLSEPNDCDKNYIEIFGEKTDLKNRIKQFCGSAIETVTSQTNVLNVRFFTTPRNLRSRFEALYTAYRDYGDVGRCLSDEYDCEDATCIDISLRCNGRINCKHRWDEENCSTAKSSLLVLSSDHIIIILTIGCLIMFGMCFACFFNCFRKLRQDHHVYQARRSRSREDHLDRIGELHPGQAKLLMAHSQSVVTIHKPEPQEDLYNQRNMRSTSRSVSTPDSPLPVGDPSRRRPNGFADPRRVAYETVPVSTNIDCETGGIAREDEDDEDCEDYDSDDQPSVEMVDNACQTRDSLFQNSNPGSRPSSDQHATAWQAPGQKVWSTTSPTMSHQHPKDHTYKAETQLQMGGSRGYSGSSAKSGPDVTVYH